MIFKLIRALFLLVFLPCTRGNSIASDADGSVVPREYCQFESFRPRCWRNEVILMKSALYGRMRVGRCVDDQTASGEFDQVLNFQKSLGCFADVLDVLDGTCSGRAECDVFVPSEDLRRTRPCSSQLTMYLEASYSCLAVVEDDRSCSVSVTTSPLHILGSPTTSSGCGTRSQPWSLEAQTGQQINISLLNVGVGGEPSRGADEIPDCRHEYGYIVDKSAKMNISICGGRAEKETNLHLSTANMIEIALAASTDRTFLIAFQATGCSNLVPPSDAWLKREGNDVTVGCYSTRQRWFLRCHGNQWHGTVGTCAEHGVAAQIIDSSQQMDNSDNYFTNAIAIVTIVSVGSAVCLIVIFIGIGCVRRYNLKMLSKTGPKSKCAGELGAGLIRDYSLKQKNSIQSNHRTHADTGDGLDDGTAPRNLDSAATRETGYGDQGQYFVLDAQVVEATLLDEL